MRIERDEALVAFGTKLLEAEPPVFRYATPQVNTPPGAPVGYAASPFNLGNAFENMAKIMVDSNHKLTGPEKEIASEAADVSHFYKLLFTSKPNVIQDDGTETKIIVPATLHPLFAPVLYANKNSKATKLLQEAVEAMSAAALAQDTDRYASAANLLPNMFDQPMTAPAIRLGPWEWKHNVLNVDGIITNFALHHLAPPNTNSTVYK